MDTYTDMPFSPALSRTASPRDYNQRKSKGHKRSSKKCTAYQKGGGQGSALFMIPLYTIFWEEG